MEEYLRRVQSRVGEGPSEGPVHAVLGGPEPDVNTVAATLCLALHLSQRKSSEGVCVPVLCRKRGGTVLPDETVKYLQRVKVSESLLLWKEDLDLVSLHHSGKLLLTLLRDGLLDSYERSTLESSILHVVHRHGQRGAEADGALSMLTTVAREILQEAAEQSRAALGEALGEGLRLQREALWIEHGCRSDELEELVRSVEQWAEGRQQDLMQLLATELKDFSDGEMTIALTSLTTDKEDWQDYVEGLKSFCHQHGYDSLVVLLSISDSVHQPRQQVAVYSNNTDMLNQICAELEESSSWALSGELEDTGSLQVYHIPINTSELSGTLPLLEEEIQDLLKNFIDRRSSLLACHPSSRTSSTEGVAGSVEFSQGSSGINDMDGSDVERVEGGIGSVVAVARVMGEREEDTGGVNAGGEILSPDSGMTTIRSSRSSKESSVFLSDDSPLGEVTASGGPAAGPGGLRNPSPLSFLSLSPPIPPERRKHRSNRNRNDNNNLFNFDPLHSSNQPLPAGGELVNSQGGGDEGDRRAGSSSLSELDELSLIDFSAPNSSGGLESGQSSVDHQGTIHGNEMMETMVPPTPVNSLVGSRPPSSCGIRFFPEDVIERINVLQHKDSMSSSLSETWDELCFDTQGAMSSADTLNRSKGSGSPQIIECEITGNDSDFTERDDRDQISKPEADHQRVKKLEPQLSLVTDQTETCENWNPDSVLQDQWKPVTLADLQLTPPEDGVTVNSKAEDRMTSLKKQKTILNTLTPDPSKEEDDSVQDKKEDQHLELLDFWTYSAQQGLLKLDNGTTASYPESLDMWNMTIRDDSISPLTTPDNLSENSGSFYGLNPNIKRNTSVESPLGFADGGMQMWNTTIQEDSSSPLTTPEGPENQKDFGHEGSLDDSLETHPSKQTEDKASEDDGGSKGENDAPEEVECRGNEHKVKIVIETVDRETQGKETSSKDIQILQSKYSEVFSDSPSKHSEDETSLHHSAAMWELPIHGMVPSTSEYDNLGPGEWSQISSPDNCASPVVDMIQLEDQSSPFIAVSKPMQSDERQNLSQTADITKRTTTDINQTANQVFLFDKEFGSQTKSGESPVDIKNKNTNIDKSEEADWTEQSSEHSPFVLVDTSNFAQDTESPRGAAEIQTNHSISLSYDNWDSHVSEKHSDSEAALSLHLHLPIKIPHSEDVPAFETPECNGRESKKVTEGKISDNLSLNYIPGGRMSNSDESLFSGLEMENIVPGTVKEANREWSVRLTQDDKQAKGTRKSMETFSILSYAATVLKTHAQMAHRDHIENTHQESQHQLVPEMISPSQSKPDSEAFSPSDCRPTEEEENKTESSTVARSVSPSLRYPSDHFLKTREEVYVRSQISMEDSDEGGESPSAPPPSATSLGDFQVWGGQLVRQETVSPVLTNSSVSPSSSLIGSPANEPSISTGKRLGLPFSGDLMEEEQDEDLDSDHSTLPKWTQEEHGEREERHELESSDLLCFSEDMIEGSSLQQTDLQTFESEEDKFLLNREDYCSPQRLRRDKWSIDRQSGDHKVSEDVYSPVLRRHQDVTSQLSSQSTCENAAFQSAGSPNTTQGQTKYGYNFHHIDQRTENQSTSRACAETKSESRQQNATEVYAEFTTDALAKHFRSKQSENQFETGVDHSLDDAQGNCQYAAESSYVDGSACTSELQYSEHGSDEQSHYDAGSVHYQYGGEPFDQSDSHPKTEDHARYVSEEYIHFHLSRNSQQGVDAAGMMMMKMASCEAAAEELDNREDPPSSADTSGGSNQRRKLSAPPINLSLEHSEGSLVSEDPLDTEDDALDTGDDLDVSGDGIDTPDETDSLEFNGHADSEGSNLGEGAASGGATAGQPAEEKGDERLWRSVVIGEQEHRIDMKCIEPYKRVISHGGYYAEKNAIIVFAACFLPDSDCDNYNYVMENLFLYVISTLELMVAEDYMIVYLNGATPRRRMPGFTWMKRCYQMIDRRLKKNLKMFFIVHPSWFVRTLLGITRPFISSKFSSKIKYVNSLKELGELIPMEYVHIPPSIIKLDLELQKTSTKVDKGNSAV